jgi:iron(III) transport system substrate-binding protein
LILDSKGLDVSTARHVVTRSLAALTAVALALGVAACGSDSQADSTGTSTPDSSAAAGTTEASESSSSAGDAESGAALTVYSGQHEDFAQALADGFTAATGIAITLRSGDDAELANQIVEEGDHSPADVFISEEPGPAAMLDSTGLTSPVDSAALDQVDARLVPSTKGWMPYAARSRVLFYNPSLISEDKLPKSIMDLTDPAWAGKFAYAPSGAFTSTVAYLIGTIGEDATLEWLKGIKANGVNEQKNGKVRDSVEAGQHAFGLSNHYYWFILAKDKGGVDKMASKVYFFDHEDAGGLLLTSGAAILKSSTHQAEAQQFLKWLGSPDGGQQVVADGAAAQFPVAPGVTSATDGLPSLEDLHFPTVDPTVYADTTAARDLIIKAGIA